MPQKVVRKRKKNYRAPVLIMLAMIILLIGGISAMFSLFILEDMRREPDSYRSPVGNVVFGGVHFTAAAVPASLGAELAGAPVLYRPKSDGIPSAPDYPETETRNVPASTVVPETAPAPEGYFDDALFIGDSISEGIKNSGAIPASQIIANKNVGLNSVAGGKPVYYTKGSEPKTLFQAIQDLNPTPGKFYILLGANGMPGFDNETHIQYYYELVEQLKAAYPKAIIYAVSVTPMAEVSDYSKKFSQEKINGFNELIRKMAGEESIYYLDVQTVLKNEKGYLVADYAPSDGLHMVRRAHDLMFEYYQHHVVLPDGTMEQVVPPVGRDQ